VRLLTLVILDRRIIDPAIRSQQSGIEGVGILCMRFIFQCQPARDLFNVFSRRQSFRSDASFKQCITHRFVIIDVLFRDRSLASKPVLS
jgi:hypothetical protein